MTYHNNNTNTKYKRDVILTRLHTVVELIEDMSGCIIVVKVGRWHLYNTSYRNRAEGCKT